MGLRPLVALDGAHQLGARGPCTGRSFKGVSDLHHMGARQPQRQRSM